MKCERISKTIDKLQINSLNELMHKRNNTQSEKIRIQISMNTKECAKNWLCEIDDEKMISEINAQIQHRNQNYSKKKKNCWSKSIKRFCIRKKSFQIKNAQRISFSFFEIYQVLFLHSIFLRKFQLFFISSF